jgi:hypothetical protein
MVLAAAIVEESLDLPTLRGDDRLRALIDPVAQGEEEQVPAYFDVAALRMISSAARSPER